MYILSYPSVIAYVLGAQNNGQVETVILITHSTCFCREIRKKKFWGYALLTKGLEYNFSLLKNEPRHEISNIVVCATSKASDQPAHTRSLIRAFGGSLNIL